MRSYTHVCIDSLLVVLQFEITHKKINIFQHINKRIKWMLRKQDVMDVDWIHLVHVRVQ